MATSTDLRSAIEEVQQQLPADQAAEAAPEAEVVAQVPTVDEACRAQSGALRQLFLGIPGLLAETLHLSSRPGHRRGGRRATPRVIRPRGPIRGDDIAKIVGRVAKLVEP